jgi:hypothetical protein
VDHCFPSSGQAHDRDRLQTYAITGPGWKGTLPQGVREFKSRTNIVWLLGRIYCTGTPEDYKAVHELQDQCKLVPLSSYGKPYTPPEGRVDPSIDTKTAVRALFAPKGTPQPILDRLSDALDRALDDENVRRRLAEIGCDVPDKARRGQSPLAALVKREIARWAPIIKAANVKPE